MVELAGIVLGLWLHRGYSGGQENAMPVRVEELPQTSSLMIRRYLMVFSFMIILLRYSFSSILFVALCFFLIDLMAGKISFIPKRFRCGWRRLRINKL